MKILNLNRCIFAAIALMGLGTTGSNAQTCSLPKIEIPGERGIEFGAEFAGYAQGLISGKAHDLFGQLLVDKYMTKLAGATRAQDVFIFSTQAGIAKYAVKYVDLLKVASVSKAVAQGEFKVVADMAVDEINGKSVEYFLEKIGATANSTLVGALMTALKITKESYEVLETEDCLTNIDIAYYSFLKDDALRWTDKKALKPGAIDHYVRNYLIGGGADKNGGDRVANRRYLQCYINANLPASERINVSDINPVAGDITGFQRFMNLFNVIGDTLGSSADLATNNKRLRLPLTVMLRDFNARFNLEEQAKEIAILRRSDTYKDFEAAIEAMRSSQEMEKWLCERLEKQAMIGAWLPTAFIQTPTSMASEPVPLPTPLAFTLDEDGTISTEIHDNDGGGVYKYKGTWSNNRLKLSFRADTLDSDTGKMEKFIEVNANGSLKGTKLEGDFLGTLMTCDDTGDKCSQGPFKGSWTAERPR